MECFLEIIPFKRAYVETICSSLIYKYFNKSPKQAECLKEVETFQK